MSASRLSRARSLSLTSTDMATFACEAGENAISAVMLACRVLLIAGAETA